MTWISRLSLLWAGVIVGCTFIATPAKFQTPVSLPALLQVGRATFRAVGAVEAVFAIAMMAIILLRKPRIWLALAAPCILVVEWLAIMPALDAQTLKEINGAPAAGGGGHVLFVVLETLKLLVLLYVGFANGRGPRAHSEEGEL